MFLSAAAFTLACAYAAGLLVFPSLALPRAVRFGMGAALISLIVFLLLLARLAYVPVFLILGVASLAAGSRWFWRARFPEPARFPWTLWIPFAIYTAMYAIQAMAPEIQPDALTYHLGLSAEYARLHSFSPRIGFYEVLPQGLEMLFTMAYALGGGSAAKLVHFAFLLSTIPLMVAVGGQLQIAPVKALLAAVLYFAMPVVGITGTSTYNDAALVFFTLATFWCMAAWYRRRNGELLAAAGFLAGFCFAIKVTGAPVVLAAIVATALVGKRPATPFIVAASALVSIAPWLLRDLLLTGNPFAPLLNALFPNPYFNAAAEHTMAQNLRMFQGFTWARAPLDYALRGALEGIVGPVFFFLPFALLSIRRRTGAVLLAAAAILLSPWFLNPGTRFLMPAFPFLALAMVSVLPSLPAVIIVAAQLVVCWPSVLHRFENQQVWSFQEIPWRAALRLEPEAVYLDRTIGDFAIARMIEERTGVADRVFSLTTAAKLYTTRDLELFWYNTRNQGLGEALQAALTPPAIAQLEATLSGQPITGIRLVVNATANTEMRIFEMQLAGRKPSGEWHLSASPNLSEATMAIDENAATSWRTRTPVERGMFFAILFDRPTPVPQWQATLPVTAADLPLLLQTQSGQRTWRTVADSLRARSLPTPDFRRDATRALRSAGFRYILARAGNIGMDRVSADMVAHNTEWGLRDRGEFTPVHLFEIE